MTRNCAAVAVMLAGLAPYAGAASELKPMQGGTFVLGDQSASIYYTVSGDTFEVVTTMGPADGSGGPVRFTSFLRPGEHEVVSAGQYRTTAPPQQLVLTHDGDVLSITQGREKVASE